MDDPGLGNVAEAGHRVVKQRRGQGLAAVVVAQFLVEGGPHRLGDGPPDLAVEDELVDHPAAVMHQGEVPHRHSAVVGRDLHHRGGRGGGVGGGHVELALLVGERRGVAGVVPHHHRQAGVHSRRQQESVQIGGAGDLGQRHRGLAHPEHAVGQLHRARLGPQHRRGDGGHLVAHLLGRLHHRPAAHHRRPAPPGAHAVGQHPGVAVVDLHIAGVDGEDPGGQAGVDRLVALALRLGADMQAHPAVGLHGEHAHLEPAVLAGQGVQVGRGGLHHLGDAHPHQAALGPLVRHPLLQRLIVDGRQQLVELLAEAAGVEHRAGDRRVGQGVVGDEVDPAHLHGVHAQPVGQHVHQPLDGEDGLGLPEPPVPPDGALVGDRALQLEGVVGQVVGVGQHAGGDHRGRAPQHVDLGRSHVGHDADPQAQHPAVGPVGHLGLVYLLPGVDARREVLEPVLLPHHRVSDPHGDQRHQRLLAHEVVLHPEAAAHVGGDHPHLGLAQPGDLADGGPQHVGRLGGGVQGEAAPGRVELAQRPVALQRQARDPVVDEALAQHPVGGGEGAVHVAVAARHVQEHVVGPVVVDQRGAGGQGGLGIDHRRQVLVLDGDQLQGVLGDVAALGHHRGDGLAHEDHLVDGHDRPLDLAQGGDGGQVVVEPAAGGGHLLAGEHGQHAGQDHGPGGVDGADAGVGLGASQDGDVAQVGAVDVAQVVALAGEEPGVLGAPNAGVAVAVSGAGARLGGVGAGFGDGVGHRPLLPAAALTASTMAE